MQMYNFDKHCQITMTKVTQTLPNVMAISNRGELLLPPELSPSVIKCVCFPGQSEAWSYPSRLMSVPVTLLTCSKAVDTITGVIEKEIIIIKVNERTHPVAAKC